MSAVELLYDYFEDHTRAAEASRQSSPVAFGILCYAAGGLALFAAQSLNGRMLPLPLGLFSAGLAVLWQIGAGFLLTTALHLILEIEGVRGSAASLFVLLGLANLVWLAALPIALILKALAPGNPWLPALAFFLLGIVVLGYRARSIQYNYAVSAARAWITLLLPYMAMAFAAALIFTAAIVAMVSQFIRWLD